MDQLPGPGVKKLLYHLFRMPLIEPRLHNSNFCRAYMLNILLLNSSS